MKKILSFLLIVICVFFTNSCYEERELNENELRITISSYNLEGEHYTEVEEKLKEMGFTTIEFEKIYDVENSWGPFDGEVEEVSIEGDTTFYTGDIFKINDVVNIKYHTLKSNKNDDTINSGSGLEDWVPRKPDFPKEDKLVSLTFSNDDLKYKHYSEVTSILGELGFYNIYYDYIFDLSGSWYEPYDEGFVESVTIHGNKYYDVGRSFYTKVVVIIKFHTSKSNKPILGNGYNFDFSLNSNGESYYIEKYIPDSYFDQPNEVKIPSQILGLPVKTIGPHAFYANDEIKKVILPDGIESIEEYAFYSCDNLTDINFPDSFRRIQNYAFKGCNSLKNLYFTEGIGIYYGAFEQCSSIEKIEIYNSGFIDDYAFCKCSSLKTVIIPGVSKIGNSAFKNTPVQTLTISEDILSIGNSAFSGCMSLKTIYVYGIEENFDPSLGEWWDYSTGDYAIIFLNEKD